MVYYNTKLESVAIWLANLPGVDAEDEPYDDVGVPGVDAEDEPYDDVGVPGVDAAAPSEPTQQNQYEDLQVPGVCEPGSLFCTLFCPCIGRKKQSAGPGGGTPRRRFIEIEMEELEAAAASSSEESEYHEYQEYD